jgi:hypothetical protein
MDGFKTLSRQPGAKPDSFSISGEGLQRLRNALTERARSTSRSNAHEIYELVDEIDASVARNHPDVAAKLNELRPKYRNSIILEDLHRAGGIERGDVSLQRLGNMMRTERSAVRRTGQDIDKLGKIGRDNKLRAIWETEGKTPTEGAEALKQGLGTDLMHFVSTPLRTRPARVLQRAYAEEPKSAIGKIMKKSPVRIPAALATGTAVRPFNPETEE